MIQSIPCTVQILTRNSAESIGRCLEALKEFAEVIVHDGYSTDGTQEIARRYPNVAVMEQDRALLDDNGRIINFAAMRNQSIARAKFDWVFVVDGNEVIPSTLVEEVLAIVRENRPCVYQASRIFYVNGERIDHCSAYPSLQIRLFHRSTTTGYAKTVHERLSLLPGVQVHRFRTELPEVFPPLSAMPAKYAYYRRLEVRRLGKISWKRWLRWLLFRNVRSVVGLSMRLLWLWIIPRAGKRMPLAYEIGYMMNSLMLVRETMPLRKKN